MLPENSKNKHIFKKLNELTHELILLTSKYHNEGHPKSR